ADIYSIPDVALAKELVQTLERSRVRTSDEEWALGELRDWDGHVRRNNLASTITHFTRAALQELILLPKLGQPLASQYSWFQFPVFLQELLQKRDPFWLPDHTVAIGLDAKEG